MPFSVRASLEQFTLAHPSGHSELTISVAAPSVADPAAGVPVLYVLDGDMLFGMAAEIGRAVSSVAGFPAHYVVGIGYDADYGDFLKRRTADLTPPIGAEALADLGGLGAAIGGDQGGGADAFLGFLADTLQPEIAARYPQAAGGEQILFGHSLGGLFAAHALLTRPASFSAFVISSPSLWWDGFSIMKRLPAFGERLAALPRQPRIFVDVGAHEQELPTSVPDGIGVTLEEAQAQIRNARMVDAAKDFADALTEAGATAVRHVAFAEDDHVSVAPAAILHGMRFALGRDL
ncbi:alpha/beta hydrolase [Sphingopyxis sp. BSN-002]|uniref:alpha/beta hydrolase n=1 Tax=Sphingopyxis sp. BSN-002 TaxID=2911495 RepID=UPI001EDB93FA|nr:alpha/beta hydrolase-fold protein [Sphingopyxis sp. BSN-002]UKK84112.1 alpha/beta hydrolase [Sphingopyxis sp. BSN-002]